ncbi:DUF3489 domain-containing protein [Ottowia testudinis]|uniref:DUF3489 domain-containing protein n=1 Tax=Ottowia testudinis TaxID=2816950 RepID=A0A975CH82_9BURK|nr:DUF3489 domain-containing protein [Ottowia testudinis]QTD46340.1 DUF3489 domain-containing protein [Ottowia testudinis]
MSPRTGIPDAPNPRLRSSAVHKFRLLLRLLAREEGVDVAELVSMTGWKASWVRGYVSRLGQRWIALDIEVQPDRETGNRRYHLRSYRVDRNRLPSDTGKHSSP